MYNDPARGSKYTSALRLFSITYAMQNHLSHCWILYHVLFTVNTVP